MVSDEEIDRRFVNIVLHDRYREALQDGRRVLRRLGISAVIAAVLLVAAALGSPWPA